MTLKAWLEIKKMTHVEFAKAMNVSQSTATRWVNGTMTPGLAMVTAVHEFTGGKVTFADWLK